MPYLIADYFKRVSSASLEFITVGGGHFVTHLVCSYWLLSPTDTRNLTEISVVPFSLPTTTSREVVYIDDDTVSVHRSLFPVLCHEPPTLDKKLPKRSRISGSLPARTAPAHPDLWYLVNEMKSIHRTMKAQRYEYNALSVEIQESIHNTQNIQNQVLWVADCTRKYMDDFKSELPHDQPPLIGEEEEEDPEEDKEYKPNEEDGEDTTHN